jgi:hypothetical protein
MAVVSFVPDPYLQHGTHSIAVLGLSNLTREGKINEKISI